MAYKAKEAILWFKQGDVVEEIQDNWKPYFEETDEKVKPKDEGKEEPNLDLDGDGDVDSDDAKIASKVMNKVRKDKKKKRK